MDERIRFVARRLEGEKMAPLCAEFGISRKTGYKIFGEYKDHGLGAPAAHCSLIVHCGFGVAGRQPTVLGVLLDCRVDTTQAEL